MFPGITESFPHSFHMICNVHLRRDVNGWLTRHLKPKIFTDESISILGNDDNKWKEFRDTNLNFFGTKFFQLMVYDSNYGSNESEYIRRKKNFVKSLKLKSRDMLHDTFFHGLDCTVFVDISEFCMSYLRYLSKEWFPYEKKIAYVYRHKNIVYENISRDLGVKHPVANSNAVESKINSVKYHQVYTSKSLCTWVQTQSSYLKKQFDAFKLRNKWLNPSRLVTNDIGSMLFKDLYHKISNHSFLFMVRNVARAVKEYNENNTAPKYKGTCTLRKLEKTRQSDEGIVSEIEEHEYLEYVESASNEILCTCLTDGLYCQEYLVERYGHDFKSIAKDWGNRKIMGRDTKYTKPLKLKNISGLWHLMKPKHVLTINNDPNQSKDVVMDSNSKGIIHNSNRIMTNSQQSLRDGGNMVKRKLSIVEQLRYNLLKDENFRKSVGLG